MDHICDTDTSDVCHKKDLFTLLLCDDLSGEDQDNIFTIKEFGGSIL